MTSPNPAAEVSSAAPRPRRSLLRFLFRTPLGIVVVLVLGLASLVACLPMLVSSFGAGYASDWFAANYRGQLKIEKLDLGWTSPQTIEGVELLDPEGASVARVSMRLPGLWSVATSRGTRLGKIEVRAQAQLTADDAGRTNLDKALEPREPKPAPEPDAGGESPPGESSPSMAERITAQLDLEVTRLEWSDAHTRELGSPFVVENLKLACALAPGSPVTLSLGGNLSGSATGEITVDARVEHPFEAPSSPTPPSAQISAKISRVPTALIDALGAQGGRLSSLLGEELSLALEARGTLQSGSVELALDSPLARVRSFARVADGILRNEGEGFSVELEVPQEFVDLAVGPLLENGARLKRLAPLADAKPDFPRGSVRFALSSFEAPVGPYMEIAAKGDAAAALETLLAGTRATWSADLGDWELDGTRALSSRGPLVVRRFGLSGELKAPEEMSRIEFHLAASNGSRHYAAAEQSTAAAKTDLAFGQARLTLNFSGGAGLASYAPDRALLPLRAEMRLEELPSAVFDSLAGTGGDLTRALGARMGLEVDLDASIEADPNSTLEWEAIGARWRELAARAQAQGRLKLLGTPTGEKLERLGGEPLALRSVDAELKLAPQKPLEASAQIRFESVAPGQFELRASVADVFADPALNAPLRFEIACKADGLPTKIADAASGQGDRLQQLLGQLLALELSAQGTLDEGVARVNVSSESAQMLFIGRLQGGMLVNMDEPVLRVSLQPDSRLLDEFVAPHLPAGTRLGFVESRGVIGLNVNFLALPLRELLDLAAQSSDALVSTVLAKTRCEAVLGLREFVYEDETLLAAGQRLDRLALQANLDLRPGDKATPLTLEVRLVSESFGSEPLTLRLDAPNAPELLGVSEGRAFAPLTASIAGPSLSTAFLDAFAGGMLRDALGPKLDLKVNAKLAQVEGAPFDVDLKLELAGSAGQSSVSVAAKVKDPFNKPADPTKVRPAGVLPELEASLDIAGAKSLLAFAPESARASLRELLSDTISARAKFVQSAVGRERAELTLDAGGVTLDAGADFQDRTLTVLAGRPMALRVTPSQALMNQLLGDSLPPGASFKVLDPGGIVSVQCSELRAPLGRFLDADPARANAELIDALDLKLVLTLPAFEYVHPGEVPSANGAPGRAAAPPAVVVLRDLQLLASLSPGAPATLDLTGKIDAATPGAIEAHVVIEKPSGFAVSEPQPFPAAGSRAILNATLAHFPTALLDVLARQDGLLLDVLGPELDAKARGLYPDSRAEPITAELHSAFGDIKLAMNLAGDVIVCEGDHGLDAKVRLTPLFSKRIIGSLVPLMVNVRQEDPAKRTIMTGRNLSLPMDSDLAKLSGDINLNLGSVEYQLLPGLSDSLSLGKLGLPTTQSTVIKPIAIRIVNGVANYDSIPIRVGDREILFKGNANLALKTFQMNFSIPLEMLGSKVESQLESLRGVLDPKLAVPLEIYGPWDKPKLRLGKGFLEKVLKDVAEDALKGELEKGLGDLLGGKKKKKKG